MSNIDSFDTNKVITDGTDTYVCKQDQSGGWCVQKVDEADAAAVVITYATKLNNPDVASYEAAIVDVTALTYGTANQAFR